MLRTVIWVGEKKEIQRSSGNVMQERKTGLKPTENIHGLEHHMGEPTLHFGP